MAYFRTRAMCRDRPGSRQPVRSQRHSRIGSPLQQTRRRTCFLPESRRRSAIKSTSFRTFGSAFGIKKERSVRITSGMGDSTSRRRRMQHGRAGVIESGSKCIIYSFIQPDTSILHNFQCLVVDYDSEQGRAYLSAAEPGLAVFFSRATGTTQQNGNTNVVQTG